MMLELVVLTLQGRPHDLVGDGARATFDGKRRPVWTDRRSWTVRVSTVVLETTKGRHLHDDSVLAVVTEPLSHGATLTR
jgi:hypothetical protein